MKIIALLALLTVTLIGFGGAIPQSSVGGPMTLLMVFLLVALIVGLYEAWSKKRGVLGWIVSIIAAVVGGILGAAAGSPLFDALLTIIKPQGALFETRSPLLFVFLNGQMIFTLLGSWIALWLVNRFR